MEFEKQEINCKTFWDTETVIKKAEDKIIEAKNNHERQYFAQDILLEGKVLLSCVNYSAENSDCISCHAILHGYIKEYKYLANDERKRKCFRI